MILTLVIIRAFARALCRAFTLVSFSWTFVLRRRDTTRTTNAETSSSVTFLDGASTFL